jgi:hypothetical protein
MKFTLSLQKLGFHWDAAFSEPNEHPVHPTFHPLGSQITQIQVGKIGIGE